MTQDTDISNKRCTTQEAARLLDVTTRTIQLWSESGILEAWKTPGGHRRFNIADIEALQTQLQKPGKQDAETRDLRIMVIEDEPDLLTLYKYAIENWGLPVKLRTASDGYEGLIGIGAWQPDILIADIQMPNLDGVHMLDVISKRDELNDMVVIVVSALSREDIEAKGRIPEGIPIFSKPIPFDQLESIVRHRCEARTSR